MANEINVKSNKTSRDRQPASVVEAKYCALFVIDHFTVVCSETWPLNGSEAGGDLVLIKTSLSLSCRSSYSYAN